jgi:hypothetical protein
MSKKTTLERAYLHINNGGLTFSIVERVDVHKNCTVFPPDWHTRKRETSKTTLGLDVRQEEIDALPKEDRYNRRWAFKVETNHFGATTQYSFPIVPLSVKWMLWALQRVLDRMEAPQSLPTDGLEYAFQNKTEMRVMAAGGQPYDAFWPVDRAPYEDSETSGSSGS